MNSNVLKYEDITENIIAFKVNKSYKENMTETELYDITRGCWRINRERAQLVDYAFSVYEGTIIEVYKIEKWLPGEELQRTTFPDEKVPKKRYGFKGEIAEKEIRDKYIGKSIIYKKGEQSPFKYFFPLQNHVPNKDEIINKEKSVINEVIEEVQKIEEEITSLNIDGKSKKAIVNVRINQGKFRDLLLKRYNNKCCLCGVKNQTLLTASHIKPWADSEPKEKSDVDNGFLMCPNHDKLFDKGYITFDDDGKIIISDRLTENNRVFLNVDSKMHIEITLTEGNKKYLKFHRENIFNR